MMCRRFFRAGYGVLMLGVCAVLIAVLASCEDQKSPYYYAQYGAAGPSLLPPASPAGAIAPGEEIWIVPTEGGASAGPPHAGGAGGRGAAIGAAVPPFAERVPNAEHGLPIPG